LVDRKFAGYLGQSSSISSASSVAQVCITWFVYYYTQSAIDVGIVAIVNSIATVVATLPAGSLVDRFNRGVLLVVSSSIAAAIFAFLAWFTRFAGFNLFILLPLAAAWSASMELLRSTNSSILPDLVAPSDLLKANGFNSSLTSTIGSVSSALAGGIIVVFGIIDGFLYGAAGYAASAVLSILTIYPFFRQYHGRSADGGKGARRVLADLKEGFRWLIHERGLWQLTLSAGLFNFFLVMALSYLVVYVAAGMHAGSLVYGIVVAMLAAGYVLGSLVSSFLRLLAQAGKFWILIYGMGTGLTLIIMGLYPDVLTAIICALTIGTCSGVCGNIWITSAQNIVPSEMRGRYFAVDGLFSSIGGPPAIAAGSIVISTLGVGPTFAIAGVLMFAFATLFLSMRSLWHLDGRSREIVRTSDL
jgi:MFS family permease